MRLIKLFEQLLEIILLHETIKIKIEKNYKPIDRKINKNNISNLDIKMGSLFKFVFWQGTTCYDNSVRMSHDFGNDGIFRIVSRYLTYTAVIWSDLHQRKCEW